MDSCTQRTWKIIRHIVSIQKILAVISSRLLLYIVLYIITLYYIILYYIILYYIIIIYFIPYFLSQYMAWPIDILNHYLVVG